MTMTSEATPLAIEDFEAIEAAVMETARGRWFLKEYASRHRQADTMTIVETLERIERKMNRQRKVPDIDRIRLDLADMAEAITRTKQEIFQMKLESEEGGRFAEASNELDAIVSQTEQATETILQNAEKAQELAWTLRENNVPAELCDELETYVTEIYTGCSFQDLTGQRTRKVVTVLRYLESRINSMTGIWGLDEAEEVEEPIEHTPAEPSNGVEALEAAVKSKPAVTGSANLPSNPFDTRPDAHLLNGPQLDGKGIDQADIDSLMDFSGSADDFVAVHAGDTGLEQAHSLSPEDAAAAALEASTPDAPASPYVAEADLSDAEPDIFAAQPAAPQTPAAEPRPRAVSVGNAALALQPDADLATDPAPVLSVVPSQDPIAMLSAEEKLIVFG